MAPGDHNDAFANDPTLSALEHAATAAMVVDGAGEIVWTNDAARPLSGRGSLDESAWRAVARIAASGSEGLARLRVRDRDRLEAVTFRSRRIRLGETRGVLLEALTPFAFDPAVDQPDPAAEEPVAPPPAEAPTDDAASIAVPVEHPAARDVAAEEGAHREGSPADDPYLAGFRGGGPLEPLDPRADLSTPRTIGHEVEPVEPDTSAEAAPAEPDVAAPLAEEAPSPDGAASVRSADDLRFVFEFDADGRLAYLSPDLRGLVGDSASAAVGRPWDDIARDLELDPTGAVADALGRRGGWNDVVVHWPTADGARAPLSLSALPMFDSGRTFVGFRGLGQAIEVVEKPSEPSSRPDEAEQDSPAASSDARDETIDLLSEASPHSEADAGAAAASPAAEGDLAATRPADPQEHADAAVEPAPEAFSPPASEPPAIVAAPKPIETFHGNVVPLREAGAPPPRAPGSPALSLVEESAFDEIARRLRGLGARVTSELPARSLPDTAEIVATARAPADWTIDDVEGRAPTDSRADDVLRLLDRLPVGALVLRAGEIAYANRATLDMAGHADLKSFVERGSAELFAEPLPRDDAAPSALRLVAKDGLEVEVEARLSTIAWQGAPATLVSLKRAEGMVAAAHDALRREKEISEILDTATDGVLTLDAAGRILSVNRSAEALFGFEERDVVGSLFTLSLAPESRRAAYDYLDSLKANGVAAVLNDGREVLGLARQGGAIPLYMTIGRIGSAQEGRYCAVLRDITHWKKAEEELLAAKRQAERASSQKSEFLARVSHEIRTPLNAIIGFAELMMEERLGPVGNARYRDYLRDIHLSGGHLVSLVNDLLDLSKVEAGRLKLEFASVDLNELVSQAAALLQPQANRDHVIIRTSLARNLPHVLADKRSIRQILTNLASNAVKFSRPGGQVIMATAFSDAGQAVIRVRDAGVGMSKKDVARALEPFRPLPTADGDGGSGIGLPLTKALAEANEAVFAMQSEIGEGTLVEVTFPAARVLAN